MTTAIVCLGNELVGDDGAGPCVARILSSIPLPPEVVVIQRPNLGIDILDLLAQYQRMVIVDAMLSGRVPGTVMTLDMQEATGLAAPPSCAHCIGVPELVQLARRIAPDRPLSCLSVVAIEGADMHTFGVGLSQAVQRALPRFLASVLRVAGLGEGYVAQAEDAAVRELRTPRGVLEVLRG